MTWVFDTLPSDGSRPVPLKSTVERVVTELADGRCIAAAQGGSGRDCIVIHGTMMTLEDMWLGPTAALSEHFRVTAVDRPGHGFSRRHRFVDASPWRQAEIIHEFVEVAGIKRPVLVGHSYGGTVALAYGALYPDETAGIVCLAPMCLPELRLEWMMFGPRAVLGLGDLAAPVLGVGSDPAALPVLWRAMFLPQLMPEAFSSGFPFALAAQFGQMIAEGEDAAALAPALVRLAPEYAQFKIPVRFFGGTVDLVVNNMLQGKIVASLMPDASFTWLSGTGHMLHHFEQAKIVEAAIAIVQQDIALLAGHAAPAASLQMF